MTDDILKPFGYNPMFSEREEIADAFEYVCQVGDAADCKPHVVTAVMVYVNTLLKVLHHNGMLNLEHSPLHERIKELEAENASLKEKANDHDQY